MAKHTDDRWGDLRRIRGLRVCTSYDELSNAVKDAALSRNPDNWRYRPVGQAAPYDGEEYGRCDELLHEKMKAAARAHFKDRPIDDNYPEEDGVDADFLREIGTPFTYQNEDWYQPTYECYIGVLLPYISSTLLLAFQRLLAADLRDWCIVVVLCENTSFGEGEQVYLFSDQALLDQDAATVLQLPLQ